MYRTHTCGELRLADVQKEVTLCGWIQKIRHLGGMIFIDLRDRYGITQLAFNHEQKPELCEQVERMGREWVIQATSNVYLIRDLFDVIPHGSRIVFTGSLMGILPHSVSLSYGVTKAAVLALAKNLVKFFEDTETTVNAIAPGFVETEWQKNKPQEIRNNIYNKTAIKRFADPKEIADAVRFCINNAFVNGSIIEVSGGYCFK